MRVASGGTASSSSTQAAEDQGARAHQPLFAGNRPAGRSASTTAMSR